MNLFSKGTVLAGAAWALFACGGSSAPESTTPAATEAAPAAEGAEGAEAAPAEGGEAAPMTAEQVKCSGINECKGKGECGAADHSCKGQNECKGKGWVMASTEDCSGKGGSVVQ